MEDNYSRLANAIIIQAVKDYKATYAKMLKHPENRIYSDEVKRQEKFFHSQWYSELTDVDGGKILTEVQLMEQKRHKNRRKTDENSSVDR